MIRRPNYLLAVLVLAALLPSSVAFSQSKSNNYSQDLLAIQQHIESNDLEGARALLVIAMRQHPSDGGLENLLGIVEIQEGHVQQATRDFSAAVQHSPRLMSAWLNLGRLRMQSASDAAGRAEALRVYERALALEPTNGEANYQAAFLLMRTGKYQVSLAHLVKLTAQDQSHVGAQAILCADEAALGHTAAADEAAKALAVNPDLTEQDVLSILDPLRAAHRADLIEIIFTAANQHQPLSPSSLRILGLAQEASGKLSEARTTLEQTFTSDPKSVEPLVDLARVAQALGDDQGALGYLAHARELQPKNANLPYQFGVICAKLNLLGEARKAMSEALALAPDDPQINLGMGRVASFAHDPTEGLPYLQKYHSLRPTAADGMLALGSAYFRAKDYDNASPWLKQAANHPTTAAEAHYYLGRIARQKSQLDEAVAELTQSESLKPKQPEVLAELGQLYVQMKKYPEAEKQLNEAIALDADNYAANFGLLQLYARTNDPRREAQSKRFDEVKAKSEEAARETMRIIEIRPNGEPPK